MQQNETTEQQAVMHWARVMANCKYPALKMLYHVPNEAKRTVKVAAILKSMGMCAGIPDLILDYPAGVYHGCRIEMKFGKNHTTPEQNEWLKRLRRNGYFVAVCYDADTAIDLLEKYINLKGMSKMGEESHKTVKKYGFPVLKKAAK